VNDRTHGRQFKARFLRTSIPTSVEGIEKYLASGMIRGIGPVYAKKLLRAFGEKVLDVIEPEPDRLREVGAVPVVRLTEVFRQAAHSRIITSAHQINRGSIPTSPGPRATATSILCRRTIPKPPCRGSSNW
jgi:ATP-dependent exoDNAse (exonuclease V) alpha subunit